MHWWGWADILHPYPGMGSLKPALVPVSHNNVPHPWTASLTRLLVSRQQITDDM